MHFACNLGLVGLNEPKRISPAKSNSRYPGSSLFSNDNSAALMRLTKESQWVGYRTKKTRKPCTWSETAALFTKTENEALARSCS